MKSIVVVYTLDLVQRQPYQVRWGAAQGVARDSIAPDLPGWAGPATIIAACCIVYGDSFRGQFIFDDIPNILENVSIRRVWPPWTSMFSPLNVGRPLVGLSLAVNYGISGLNVWSYHLMNLVIHILAALALFGIVRRTLLSPRLVGRFGRRSAALALLVSLIWAVHPIQTESVTYVIQRCESMMGMFYLTTLYCAIRGLEANRKGWWYIAAIAACGAGMLSKQVMVGAPIVVLVYDFLFRSASIKESLKKHWPLYSGLAATWGILAVTVAALPASASAGFGLKSITPFEYLKAQLGVVVYYLRLSLVPTRLCLDYYGWPREHSAAEVAPYAVFLSGLAAVTAWGILRRRPAAFIGAWFFLIISVTSSVMPIDDLACEHRMYLPLASVVALVVLGGYVLGCRLLPALVPSEERQRELGRAVAVAVATGVIGSLGVATARRNVDYLSPLVMWKDVISKYPDSCRAHGSLGFVLLDRGLIDDSIAEFSESLRLSPVYWNSLSGLGRALFVKGSLDRSIMVLQESLRIRPGSSWAHYYLGRAFLARGNLDESISNFFEAVKFEPTYAEAHFYLAFALAARGNQTEAAEHYDVARRLWPELFQTLSEENEAAISPANMPRQAPKPQ